MAIYIFLSIFPVALGIFFPKKEIARQQRRRYFMICGAVMLFIMGCRDRGLGSADTLHYYKRMEHAIFCDNFKQFFSPDLYEAGFQVFMFVLSRVFHHPQWLLVVTSLFYIVSVFYFIDRNSNEIALSTTLYISLGMMTFQLQGMRQAIAMSFCLFAYQFAKEKRFWKFMAVILLAITFHETAIVFVIAYWLVNLKLIKRNVFLVFAILVVANIFSLSLIDIANTLFGEEYSGAVDSGGFVAVAIYIIALIVCWLYYAMKKEDVHSSLVFILIVGGGTYLMRYTGSYIAERISFYFSFSQIALIPIATRLVVPDQRRVVRTLILALGAGLFAYRLGGTGFLPYAFFWS